MKRKYSNNAISSEVERTLFDCIRDSSTTVAMTIFNLQKHTFLLFILLLALFLRLYGINWDAGYHFHPDERMLIMVTDKIQFFTQLNPDFFNYGSLPVYILAATGQIIDALFGTRLDTYDGLLYIGRTLSTINDLFVIILIYNICRLLFNKKAIGLWSAFFYAVSFFPIQNSHFFIVDTFLNLYLTFLVYLLLKYQAGPSYRKIVIVGLVFAAALTTKVTSIIFLPVILLALLTPAGPRSNMWRKIKLLLHKEKLSSLSAIVKRVSLFVLTTGIFCFLFMPYAFFEYDRFLKDISLQIQMNSNPYIFPYTLQYVGTLPYLYYLKNIFLWGLGPVISIFCATGILIFLTSRFRQIKSESLYRIGKLSISFLSSKYVLLTLFYLIYFVVIGRSAVKFMRYMLPLYPFLTLWAGFGAASIVNLYKPKKHIFSQPSPIPAMIIAASFVGFTFLWTLPFIQIYSIKSTRIRATEWINHTIPAGSTLAVEHWDDRVPIHDPGKYQYEEMTLYDIPDNDFKWDTLHQKLDRSDYIIIASNRLYIPLQRLQECGEHGRCYPMTAEYYDKLFNGELGFVKVAEFTSYPQLRLGDWSIKIIDDQADESFTVYDHPKIMIFKKL